MRIYSTGLLILSAFLFLSCHTLNSVQSSAVKKFAGTAKEVSDLPYKAMCNYYEIKFKRRQLVPEIYVTGDTEKENLDKVAESVITKIESIRDDYNRDLKTAGEIGSVYELLQTYIKSLETLSGDKYASDFVKKTAEMGTKMNSLVSKVNSSSLVKTPLPLSAGQWLASLATLYGRTKLKTKQAILLKEYINQADTLVQAINHTYQEIQVPIMNAWCVEEKQAIRDQFKRSISPYLQTLNQHPGDATSIAAIEFFSRINPVYYELTDEVYDNELLIRKSAQLMNRLADTHRSLKQMFVAKMDWFSVVEEVEGMKGDLVILKDALKKK